MPGRRETRKERRRERFPFGVPARERAEPDVDPWDFGRAMRIWARRFGPSWTFDYREFARRYGW